MTKTQTREALRANDENLAMDLLTEIMKAKDIDTAAALLERIQAAERANTVEDICIDLIDFHKDATAEMAPGLGEAVEIIKVNY